MFGLHSDIKIMKEFVFKWPHAFILKADV